VRLNVAYDDVGTFRTFAVRGLQHGIRLTDASRVTKEYAKFATLRARFLFAHAGQKLIRVGTIIAH
jgi:hypothetical protein